MRFRILATILLPAAMSLFSLVSAPADAAEKGNKSGIAGEPAAIPYPLTKADSLSVGRIRARMDSIRRERPTVALVLSGGGAKGAAQIGVLKYLESIDMPIDMVLGTSMGGLIGGIYALGYTADQIDSIIRTVDWTMAMSDAVPREYISYAESEYREKYVLSIPFYYDTDYYKVLLEDEMKYVDTKRYDEQFSLGADSGRPADLIKEHLLGSLPSGYIFGQNVYNLINGLSVGYQDSISFSSLPIPFVCVATEMVSGTAKYWHSGYFSTAMRSTMSIPGVFAPVKVDGMVLVDGGMRDNYPTAMARSLGADIVIGVEVSTDRKQYNEINNIGDIISQGIDMLGRSVYEYNMTLADINIHPHLPGYDMMSFDAESIDRIIHEGYVAAYRNEAGLKAIKDRVGRDTTVLHNRKAIDLNMKPVVVSGVDIRGVSDREKAILMRRIDIRPGDSVTRSDVEHVVAEIFGTQCYDYVTYEMEGAEEPFNLVLNCKPGPVHQLGIGLRLDSEELVSVLVNVGLNAHRLQGSKYDFTGRISVNPYFQFHYSYDAPKTPTLNATASVRWTDLNFLSFLDFSPARFNFSYLNVREEFFLSNIKWSMFDLKAGIRNDYFNVRSAMSAGSVFGDYDLDQLSNDYVSLFLNARSENLDDGYFPSHGYTAGISYGWTFAGFPYRFNNFHALQLDGRVVVPGGDFFAFIPSVNLRVLLGSDVPLAYINAMGGSIPGRYIDQQMPFVGVNNVSAMKNILTVFRTDYRFRVAKNHYVTGILNYARDSEDFRGYTKGLGYFGAGLEYSFDAIFGPVSANIHWSNVTKTVGFYVNIGYWF